MTNNAKPKISADAVYKNAHLVAQDYVSRIRQLLFDMQAPNNSESPINWGHVGDIDEINLQLARVIDFMIGADK